jgi:cysteine desulfurase/selenocysteine lyase
MDVLKVRDSFPILRRKIGNYPLVYFDNAATTQKPQNVIGKIKEIYEYVNSNIHRGNHYLSNYLTAEYEGVRNKIKDFINAASDKEIIFTSGTTASINLLAYSFAEKFLTPGDEIITSELEHHSNIVPWQIVCNRKGAFLKYIPLNEGGYLEIDELENLISSKTKLITVAHVANSTGEVNNIEEIIKVAHKYGIPVMIDAAQSVQHIELDVQKLDCDFLVFSGHKIYGPTGTGILYGKRELLEQLPPFMGGGEMIDRVTMKKTTYNSLPFKFEAGTPNYTGVIALGQAIDFVEDLGISNIAEHEKKLYGKAVEILNENQNIDLIGYNDNNVSALSFVHKKIPAGDLGVLLDKFGIAVRTGTHCAQPAMDFFGVAGTVRLSLAVYNTSEELDIFAEALSKIEKMFA